MIYVEYPKTLKELKEHHHKVFGVNPGVTGETLVAETPEHKQWMLLSAEERFGAWEFVDDNFVACANCHSVFEIHEVNYDPKRCNICKAKMLEVE